MSLSLLSPIISPNYSDPSYSIHVSRHNLGINYAKESNLRADRLKNCGVCNDLIGHDRLKFRTIELSFSKNVGFNELGMCRNYGFVLTWQPSDTLFFKSGVPLLVCNQRFMSNRNLSGLCQLSFLGGCADLIGHERLKFRPIEVSFRKNVGFNEVGMCRNGGFLMNDEVSKRGLSGIVRYQSNLSVELSSLREVEEEIQGLVEKLQGLVGELRREERRAMWRDWSQRKVDNEYQALWDRQIKIETESWRQAANEYKEFLAEMCKRRLAPNIPYVKSLFLGWFEPLRNSIMEDQELKNWTGYRPYFDQLPADMMAVITMHKVMEWLLTGTEAGVAKVVPLACAIGGAVEEEVRIRKFLEKTKKKNCDQDINDDEGGPDGVTQNKEQQRKKVDYLIMKQKRRQALKLVTAQGDWKPWGTEARAKVGSRLIHMLISTAYIQPPANQSAEDPPDIRPAFVRSLKTVGPENKKAARRYGIIECDPQVLKGLEKTPRHIVIPYMPMLVPPVKWTGYDKGAYLVLRSFVIRTHGFRKQREAVKKASYKQLELLYEALDTLGNTKWRVNKKVLGIVERIWDTGGRLADLVDRDDVLLPEKPDSEDESELREWKLKVISVKKENRERHSQRCDIELKLAVARKMKDEHCFFYPHNIDFRGRAYPMHPYVNHLGSDMCRGILEFAEGRPLGKSGVRWLKIHVANLFAGGVDKLSFEGRIAFTENHLEDVFDSAYKPLEGSQWWLKAEDPFQCLAVCMDLAEALRSPNPEAYVSHIPVHQDGSCNGLQHYAALGRDKLGAAAVNLVGGEKPADVYSGTAARVLAIMQADAEKDPEAFPEALHARRLINQVDRNLVKQTVMTSVYGVTYIGARDQIKRRLKERAVSFNDEADLFRASCYAAKTTLTALGEMFQAARGIMSWLGDCAKLIATENQPVRWTTPIGLPVVQPYCKKGVLHIKTSLQTLTLQKDSEKIMVKQQRTAFPPNFIHSLDGSHMMMTALACKKAGLNFAGVHDSFWTHACDVDQMNMILREKFVELYEQPILENLLESFQESFPELEFPPLPERGDFDLKEVMSSPYFFS